MEFAASLKVFALKASGDLGLDTVDETVRRAGDLRPLDLKNCDNKLICSLWAVLLSPVIAEQTHEDQRGFVQGRQLIQNVVDMVPTAGPTGPHRSLGCCQL